MITRFRYHLEVLAFITGAVLMIFELAGSRVLSPYFGSSLYVWSSIIGVILAFLSLGYYCGGKLADRTLKLEIIWLILFLASLSVFLVLVGQKEVVSGLAIIKNNVLAALFSSILLFSLPSFFLAVLNPYATRLKIKTVTDSGEVIGRMSAISTIGSICGTFLAGFYLISAIGTNNILILISLILAVLMVLYLPPKSVISFFAMVLVLVFFAATYFLTQSNKIDIDTMYDRYSIFDTTIEGRTARILSRTTNTGESAIFLDNKELVFKYQKTYDIYKIIYPGANNFLMIGGGTFSYPNHLLDNNDVEIDVVEIDPKMVSIAKNYFYFMDRERLDIIIDDGRNFLNKNEKKYQVIFVDAFKSSGTIPYYLTTVEVASRVYRQLDDKGIVMMNIISPICGGDNLFLASEYLTYRAVFPSVKILQINNRYSCNSIQNVMLIAGKQDLIFSNTEIENQGFKEARVISENEINSSDAIILTDDFAPVDQFVKNIANH